MPPLDMTVDALLYAVAPALVAAAALFALFEWLGGPKGVPLGATLGLSVGMAWALWLRGALTLMSGESAWNRLPWAAAALLGIGLATRWQRLPRVAAWLVRAACVA